jgi:hypothetical protein
MTSCSIFFRLIGKFLRLFTGLLNFSPQNDIWLDSLCQIQIPYLYFGQETGYNCIVAFCRIAAVDGSEVDFKPSNI